MFPAAVVSSFLKHDQPLGAVNPVAPFIVIVTEQVFAPRVIFPDVACPVVEDTEHPEVVKIVVPASVQWGCGKLYYRKNQCLHC